MAYINPQIQLTEGQAQAWELLMGEGNVFITGEAGSGKSFLIRQFIRHTCDKNFPVLASTGAAAVIVGGRTFHSFMGLGIMEGGREATVARALEDKRAVRRLKKSNGIIIDEISMLSGETLAAAEAICRGARRSDEPWGGLRVVAVGDFAQLPPVMPYGAGMSRDWAFQNHVWQDSQFCSIVLERNLRTGDADFLNVLNDVRNGKVTDKVESFLNSRMDNLTEDAECTRLFPRRVQTESYNSRELSKLDGELFRFETQYQGSAKIIEQLKKHSPLPDCLELKIGALVMLRQNDAKLRWVNGSTGHIRAIGASCLIIELLSGREVELEPTSFSLLSAEGVEMASATNFPVTLAYAATIHKAQGMTLDRLSVDLSALWEPGQAYVALSRVTNPNQLYIESWQPQSIKADKQVSDFYKKLSATPHVLPESVESEISF